MAAAISSRSMGPRAALAVASLSEFAEPFLFGTAVAATIGRDWVQASAMAWNLTTLYFGLPSSSTHALLGGPASTTQVVSAAIIGVGSAERVNAVRWQVAGQIVTAGWLPFRPAHSSPWSCLPFPSDSPAIRQRMSL